MTTVPSPTRRVEQDVSQGSHPVSRLPGPPWYKALENTARFLGNALAFSEGMRQQYGDVVSVPTLVGRLTLVFHPDGVRRVLQENHFNYNKDIPDYQVLSRLLGKGLLTNDGDSWLQQRRLMQPAFHRDRVNAFGAVMTDTTMDWMKRWEMRRLVDTDEPLDMLKEMSALTLSIVCKALFGADLPDDQLERVRRALTTANHRLSDAFYIPGILSLPTPQRHQLAAARRELHAVVDELVRQRRVDPGERNDLLAMLLEARDAETGEGMADSQVRDEVLTLLLAGHETTANVLSWTFYLLARHREIATKLHDEYRRVLAGRRPALDDVARLSYGRMVIEESMRLYPPAWAVGRRALADDEIGGYVIPKGAYILLFQSVTHRHPDFWEQPDVFDPERFSSERAAERHRFAYFPFGGGPRLCIGNQFALTEAQLILATILSRFELRLTPDASVVPEPLVTLRPRGTLLMTVQSVAE